jgi:hypothetical protein
MYLHRDRQEMIPLSVRGFKRRHKDSYAYEACGFQNQVQNGRNFHLYQLSKRQNISLAILHLHSACPRNPTRKEDVLVVLHQ